MSLRWRGVWNASTAYSVDDSVAYERSTYSRLVAGTTATAPDLDATNWDLLSTWAGSDTTPGTGTGGASGSAGGVLSGTYPNPGFAVDMATQAELDAAVAGSSVPSLARTFLTMGA